ncbi:hypothetical protein D3C80_1491760 [compost metagenome]
MYSYRFAGLDSNSGDPLGYLAGEKSSDYAKLLSVSPDELVYNGPARPTYFGALRNSFNYKNFSLSFNISYKFGYYFRRNSISYTQLAQTWSGHKDYERRWKQAGDELITSVPSMPELLNSSRDDFYLKSEALVEDASHIRLQDINLSYTLNKSVMKGLPLRSLQFYLYASNLGILWSKNKEGIDPDAVPNGGALLLPAPKSIAVGIKADF